MTGVQTCALPIYASKSLGLGEKGTVWIVVSFNPRSVMVTRGGGLEQCLERFVDVLD